MVFRRKSDSSPTVPSPEVSEEVESSTPPAGDAQAQDVIRATGPWDIADVTDLEDRIDLGSLLIKGVPGLSLQVQVDEKTQRVTMITLVLEDAAVQVQAFAAPRTGGIWNDVRPQIATTVTSSGGLVEEAEGPFGTELRARVPGPDKALQPARFVGVDGPRWFLRGLFLGRAASPEGHPGITEVFSNIAVSRGAEAKPSGEPLPLHVPTPEGESPAVESPDARSQN